MKMNLKALRETLTTRKALYNDNLRKNEEKVAKMQKDLSVFTPDRIARLQSEGFNVSFITTIDYERLKTDAEYNKLCSNSIQDLCEIMYERLAQESNV